MSDATLRHCYVCRTYVDGVDRGHGWLHCPVCSSQIGFMAREPSSYAPGVYVYETGTGTAVKDKLEVPKPTNPKTLMGRRKLSTLSVVPPASIICEAEAMHYGAFDAPRADGTKGYGPFNWRDDPVEMMIYLDACLRHILALVDGEEFDPDSGKSHLGHAKACLGIVADAKANGTLIDDRPKVRKGAAAKLLAQWKTANHMTNLSNGEPK